MSFGGMEGHRFAKGVTGTMTSTISEAALPPFSPSRIRIVSGFLSAACLAGIVVLPLIVAGRWAFAAPDGLLISDLTHIGARDPRILGPVADWQRLAGAVLQLIPLGFALMALQRARQCFGLFARGSYFDAQVVSSLRRFAGMSAISVALGLVLQAPLTAVVSFHNPPGQRFIEIGVSSQEIYSLFFSATVWLIAAVMSQAVRIARENAQFI